MQNKYTPPNVGGVKHILKTQNYHNKYQQNNLFVWLLCLIVEYR